MSVWERRDTTGTIKENPLNLSADEEKSLQAIQEQLKNHADHQPIIADLRDATVVRFAKRNAFDVAATVEQIAAYLKWRKDNGVDKVLETPSYPGLELIRKIVPYAYHQFDIDGRPIYLERTGMINVAALANRKLLPEEQFFHSHIFGMETLHARLQESSLKRGQRVDGICTILDMTGLGFHHRSVLHILKNATDFDNKYYPEILGRLFVVNAPWVAPYLYQAVQVFLDKSTIERVQIINDLSHLRTAIDSSVLPKEYGGAYEGAVAEVLKSDDLLSGEESKADDGLEKELVSYDFTRVIESDATGGVFNWYFECDDGYDIDFSVEVEADGKTFFAKQPSRCTTNKGSFIATGKTKVTFKWDNNFSYFTSKNIKYLISCMKEDQVTKST